MKQAPKCSNCKENDCMEYPAPHETIFSIPFTKIEIRILNYAKPTYHDLCSDCAVDAASHTSQQEQAYDAGYDAGYNKGMIDAHHLQHVG